MTLPPRVFRSVTFHPQGLIFFSPFGQTSLIGLSIVLVQGVKTTKSVLKPVSISAEESGTQQQTFPPQTPLRGYLSS